MRRRSSLTLSGFLATALLVNGVPPVRGQGRGAGPGPEPLTFGSIRELAVQARTAARGDKNEIVLSLDDRVRSRWGDFETYPVPIVKREDLRVDLTTPYMTYRLTLVTYLLSDRPVDAVPWTAGAVVHVEPTRIDAPDIIRIVVERGGRAVTPLEDRLRPASFSDGSGGQAVIHAGEVRFPLAAFAPGASVTIRAVPATGDAFAATLDDARLAILR
jgi:hypothetical protein